MNLDTNVKIDDGPNAYGVRRQVLLEGDSAFVNQQYDAEPLIDAAAEQRTMTAGERWGDMRRVGFIPMAELTRIHETFQGEVERKAQIMLWLKANPKFVTFDKFLK